MKTLIIYSTKYGATKKIAEDIAKDIEGATLLDIQSDASPSIAGFDCVVIGSSLMAGMIGGNLKTFVKEHAEELKSKRLGLFLSGLSKESEDEFFRGNFSPDILEMAQAKAFLGGIYDPAKCGFVARRIIKTVAKLDSYTDTIDQAGIQEFVQQLVGGEVM